MKTFYKESMKEIPVIGGADVAVCGAGPAGVVAALAAARAGANVQIIEAQGCLGGIWTLGLLSWILDMGNKNGILKEIIEKLTQRNAGYIARESRFICDGEQLNISLGSCAWRQG